MDIENILSANRAAIDDLISAAENSRDNWTTARAPGKWSPSHLVEHVAITLDESAKLTAGEPADFPSMPSVVHPLMRIFLFNRVLKKQRFPKAKTFASFDPEKGPASPEDARDRLLAALTRFADACRIRAADGEHVQHTVEIVFTAALLPCLCSLCVMQSLL